MLNLIGVTVAFVVIIFLIRKKFNFGLSLIVGSLIVGIFSLQEIQMIDIPKAIIEASFYSFKTNQIYTYTIELAILMTVIYVLAKLMQETGSITKIIESLRPIFSRGGILGLIPALYGLMPVPGGALFSAPMIDEEGEKYKLNQNQKNYLNVWFRHIWFPIYPISSAMILICSVEFSNIEISTLMLVNIPAFLISIIIGLFFLRRFLKNNNFKAEEKIKNKDMSGLKFLLPPIIPLFIYAVLWLFGVSQIRAFLIGVIISLFLVYFLTKISFEKFINLIKKSLNFKLAIAIFGIMIFRQMISVSGADMLIADLIKASNIPTISMIVLIPLILGVLTGYNLGAVALSYPIIQPFFPQPINGITIIGLTSLIFISSVVGYLISPIHLCNVLSSDYLKTDTTRMYKLYVPSAVVMLLVQIVFVVLLINIF
jgi:uncharacterized protein